MTSLNEIAKSIQEIMTEFGIGENTFFIESTLKRYSTDRAIETDIKISCWTSKESHGSILQVNSTNVDILLRKLRLGLEERLTLTPSDITI